MSAKIKHIKTLINEGKHTIAMSKLITLRNTVEKGSLQYAQVLKMLGSLYYYYGEFTISMDFYKSAVEELKKYDQKYKIHNTQFNISLIYIKLQRYDDALIILNQLLNDSSIKTKVRWNVILRKADICQLLGKLDEARSLYDQLLEETFSDTSTYIQVLINSAINFHTLKQTETAKEHFLKAIQLSNELRQARLLLYSNMNYATFLAENNQFDKALDLLLQCLETTQENNNKISIRTISTNISKIYELKDQIKEANNYKRLAHNIDLEMEKERIRFMKHAK